jgi:hypothetical protein
MGFGAAVFGGTTMLGGRISARRPGASATASAVVVAAVTLATLTVSTMHAIAHDAHPPAGTQASALTIRPDRLGGTRAPLPAERQLAVDLAGSAAAEAFAAFRDGLNEGQRRAMSFPLNGPERTSSRDARRTPAFCAVLAWCVPGWGLPTGGLSFEQRAAFERLLAVALGSQGYGTITAVRNRQLLIGTLEEAASPTAIRTALATLPADTAAPTLAALLDLLDAAGVALPKAVADAVSIGGMNPGEESWVWPPPGLAARWNQFEDYAVSVFGDPGRPGAEATWSLRLEGHHLSINLTFLRVGDHWEIHGTPLFIGAYPIIVPPPTGAGGPDDPLAWQQGQSLGLGITHAAKAFWQAVPAAQRVAAHRAPTGYPQRPPLLNQTPTAEMLTALAVDPPTEEIAAGPHVRALADELPPAARRALASLYEELIVTLHPDVAATYRDRLQAALTAGSVVATWAGGDLADPGSQHFSSIRLGPLLIELLQTPQYSVSSARVPWANHLHVMLRDLSSPVWGDPLRAHLASDHAEPH